VLIPKDNVRDLEEIDQTVRAALRFIPVETVDEVFAAALCPAAPVSKEEPAVAAFVPTVRESAGDTSLRQ
jgi:ATP-dependent Lon protease